MKTNRRNFISNLAKACAVVVVAPTVLASVVETKSVFDTIALQKQLDFLEANPHLIVKARRVGRSWCNMNYALQQYCKPMIYET